MKVWVTKFALTSGIQVVEDATPVEMASFPMVTWDRVIDGVRYNQVACRDEFHLTEEAAKVRAEEMRKKKVKALQRQIAKLEALKF